MVASLDDVIVGIALACCWTLSFFAFKALTYRLDGVFGGFKTTTRSSFAIFANSSVHSILSSAHAAVMLHDLFASSATNTANQHHDRFRAHLLAELSYYVVDTVVELREKVTGAKAATLKTLFLLHHVPLLFGYAVYIPWSAAQSQTVYYPTSVLVTMTWLVHASTPLQNLRWMMDRAGVDPKRSVLYRANFFLFVVLFAVIRVYGIFPMLRSVVWIKQLPHPETTTIRDVLVLHMPLKCVVGTALLYLLNLAWFAQNCRRAWSMLVGRGGEARVESARKAE